MKIIVFTFDLLESFIVVFKKSCSKNSEDSPVEWLWSETAAWAVLLKKVFLKQTPTQVFSCETSIIFKKTYINEHLWTSASESYEPSQLMKRKSQFQFSFKSLWYVSLWYFLKQQEVAWKNPEPRLFF